MKQNKVEGFTLIELLAVIVILAIIALIATPIVLSIISDSKESSGLRSAEMYLDAALQSVSLEKMNNTNFNPNSCNITSEGNLYCDNKDMIKVEVNGEKPINGSITFEEGKITDIRLVYENDKIIVKDEDGNLVYSDEPIITYTSLGNYQHKASDGTVESHDTESGNCSKCGETVLAPGLYDENNVMVVSWEESGIDNICSNASTIITANTNISIVVIPNSVTTIQSSAFNGCSGLKLITIPNSVTAIGTGAFSGCSGLTFIIIPNNVGNIGNGAFQSCTGLKNIVISDSVTSIAPTAFNGCSDLTIYYSGTATGSPWSITGTNIIVKPYSEAPAELLS